jgi:glutamate 5-kinase
VCRGLVNYSSEEAQLIQGKSTEQFVDILGYLEDEELIHRDNLVVVR